MKSKVSPICYICNKKKNNLKKFFRFDNTEKNNTALIQFYHEVLFYQSLLHSSPSIAKVQLLEVKLPFDPVCQSVGRPVGLTVGLSSFPKKAASFTSMLLSEHLFFKTLNICKMVYQYKCIYIYTYI